MSGGLWNYAGDILRNEMFGYDGYNRNDNPLEDRELSNLALDFFRLLHVFSFYKEGDSGEEDWKEAKDVFKKKWMKKPTVKQRLTHEKEKKK